MPGRTQSSRGRSANRKNEIGHLGPLGLSRDPSGKAHPPAYHQPQRPSRLAPVAKNRGPPVGTSDLSGSRDPSGAIQRTKKLFEANPGRERPEASCKPHGTSYSTTPNPANQSETDFVSTLAGMARGEPLAPRTPQDRTDNLTGIQPPSPGERRASRAHITGTINRRKTDSSKQNL
ncbi:hypothetical protein RP20_CCG012525 [Aedes albopictus]|nr:hypothetical protein RP20_CCG012525 [Aedes albopictus]